MVMNVLNALYCFFRKQVENSLIFSLIDLGGREKEVPLSIKVQKLIYFIMFALLIFLR